MKDVFENPVILSDEEQMALLLEYPTADDPRRVAIQEQFCSCYTKVISSFLGRFPTDHQDDLRQQGYLAVIKALDKFNPKAGTAFYVFASVYIHGYLLKADLASRMIHYPETSVWRPIRRIDEFLVKHPMASDARIAKALHLSTQTVKRCRGIIENPPVVFSSSADSQARRCTSRCSTNADAMVINPHPDADFTQHTPADTATTTEEVDAVRAAIGKLPPKMARAVRLLHGIDCEQLTTGLIARRMRIKKVEAAKLVKTAQARLQDLLKGYRVQG